MNNIRIFHPSAKEWMKRGFKDYFAVYVGMGLSAVALMGFAYDFKDGAHITRYKSVYTIFRAGDDLCKLYPVEFITDKQNLASDHPKTLADCEDLPKGTPIHEGRLFKTIDNLFR